MCQQNKIQLGRGLKIPPSHTCIHAPDMRLVIYWHNMHQDRLRLEMVSSGHFFILLRPSVVPKKYSWLTSRDRRYFVKHVDSGGLQRLEVDLQ